MAPLEDDGHSSTSWVFGPLIPVLSSLRKSVLGRAMAVLLDQKKAPAGEPARGTKTPTEAGQSAAERKDVERIMRRQSRA